MLQEQVAEYLDIRGIQRKYPGVCVWCMFVRMCEADYVGNVVKSGSESELNGMGV